MQFFPCQLTHCEVEKLTVWLLGGSDRKMHIYSEDKQAYGPGCGARGTASLPCPCGLWTDMVVQGDRHWSSGQLSKLGRTADPLWTAQCHLLAASSPHWWAPVDADVDQWTLSTGQSPSSATACGEGELLQAASDERKCLRNVLNGSAL
eukprot:GFUD01126030.1.p1 GENE.GFUD01126030.1~~GFUD01126030.1.p1  ORF type:complete len:149 (+),score=30.61 GFUD01126030.1:52-498(+)